MPQLNSASFISQAFWLIVCFCTLWALLSIFVTPKLADILEKRKRKINDYIQKADQLNYKAKLTAEKYDAIISKAQQQAEKYLSDGKQDLQMLNEQIRNNAETEIKNKIAEGERILAKEKLQTFKQIENISQDIALSIVKKLGFNAITRQDIIDAAHEDKING